MGLLHDEMTQTCGLDEELMVQSNGGGGPDPFVLGRRQVWETCYWTAWRLWGSWPLPLSWSEEDPRTVALKCRRAAYRALPDTKGSEETAGKVRVCWGLGREMQLAPCTQTTNGKKAH